MEVSGKNRSPIPDRQSLSRKAVVLLSGGIDSSTALAMAKAEGYELYALSFDYGQRHGIELESAKLVSESLRVGKHLIIKFDLREIGGSALTSDMEVPKKRMKDELGRMNGNPKQGKRPSTLNLQPSTFIPVTYVPARNTIFLSFGLAWAEALGADHIFIGANAVDYSGYPDCRPEYLRAFEDMANLATKVSVEGKVRFSISAPLLFMTKAEIIRKGSALGLDYSLTWSCYDPQEKKGRGERENRRHGEKDFAASPRRRVTCLPDRQARHDVVPCGRCDSCLFRAKGFKEAGIEDPLKPYRPHQ